MSEGRKNTGVTTRPPLTVRSRFVSFARSPKISAISSAVTTAQGSISRCATAEFGGDCISIARAPV
jgi:hypothetical protein